MGQFLLLSWTTWETKTRWRRVLTVRWKQVRYLHWRVDSAPGNVADMSVCRFRVIGRVTREGREKISVRSARSRKMFAPTIYAPTPPPLDLSQPTLQDVDLSAPHSARARSLPANPSRNDHPRPFSLRARISRRRRAGASCWNDEVRKGGC